MKTITFYRNRKETVNTEGQTIYYFVHQINGIGEPLTYQVDWESGNGEFGSVVFENRVNHIEHEGNHYYLK